MLYYRVSELTTTSSSLQTQKRKLEQEIQAMHSEIEDQINELKVRAPPSLGHVFVYIARRGVSTRWGK